ncbi:hypothetical protein [Mucilaginibacter arboris]|uniref:Outer membrane protein beta-barrel domain-containing protein n=1 Tax=Mucilaginibacter arboris TaxID=2682090 RepID=A0A7K1SRT0_9SPHI|nr:hypothetical protein [Mucilaginibacter arboris]MVN20026.1 hypothetical protein [Mucilaginibacter arboris]
MRKSIVLIAWLFLSSKICIAQLSYNFSNYSIGAGSGLTRAFADVAKQINKTAYFVNLNYNYSPFTTFTGELQIGKLAGGDIVTDPYKRAFENSFKAAIIYADFQAGEYIEYRYSSFLNIIKNFYAGTGIGVIHNSMSFIQRTSLDDPGYIFPGQDASTELMLPVRFGYEFKLYNSYHEPYIRINAGCQMNWVYGEGLDGYNDPPTKFKNHYVDRYGMIGAGIKYSFGNAVSYKKPIRAFY